MVLINTVVIFIVCGYCLRISKHMFKARRYEYPNPEEPEYLQKRPYYDEKYMNYKKSIIGYSTGINL